MSRDTYMAAGVWIILVGSAALMLVSLAAFGVEGTLARLPRADWSDVLIANAVFMLLIAGSDFPHTIRSSTILRTAVASWAVLFLVFGLLFASATRSIVQAAMGYFISAILMIVVYSGGVVYRGWKKRGLG